MVILIPSFLYFITALLILLIHRFNTKFKYLWLVAFINTIIIWLFIWFIGKNTPIEVHFSIWKFLNPLSLSLLFRLDSINWSIFLMVSTIMVAVLTTDPSRPRENYWLSWSGGFGMVGVGMLMVLSANLITIIFLWIVIDIIQLILAFTNAEKIESKKNAILFFSTNIIGVMVAIGAFILSSSEQVSSELFISSRNVVPYLIFAGGMRLGILPLQTWLLQSESPWEDNFLPIKIIPPLSSLILLIRVSTFSQMDFFNATLFLFSLIAGLYSANAWVLSKNESNSITYSFLGISSMVVISSIFGDIISATSWTLVLMSVGGFWVIYSTRERKYWPVLLLITFILLSFPFSPNYFGSNIFNVIGFPFSILVFCIPIILSIGVIKKFQWNSQKLIVSAKWIPILYLVGLFILPITHYLSVLNGELNPLTNPPFNISWILSIGILLIVYRFRKISNKMPINLTDNLGRIFSLKWFYSLLVSIYKTLQKIMNSINVVLESRSGIIWSVIVFSIFISLVSNLEGNISP